LCLEYLSKAEGANDDKQYWLCQDMRENDEHRHSVQLRWTREVIEKSNLPIRYIQRKPHLFAGNSYNTLEAYKEAYESEARLIYLVEEDVVVSNDYFLWTEAIQEKEKDAMCSIGYRCVRNSEARKDISDPTSYFVSSRDFASIACAWRRERLGPLVQHAKPEYYWQQGKYLDEQFPDDIYSGWFHEQDGCVMRTMHAEKAFTVWASRPRAFHIGNIGYHRPQGVRGNGQLQDKINFVRSWMHDAEQIKLVAPDFGDIEPVPTEPTPAWDAKDLHCVQRFE
jgi:hypothetical protein